MSDESTVVTLHVETAPYPQTITAPCCGEEMTVYISERTSAVTCDNGCGRIEYVHDRQGGDESEENTEQTELVTDGGTVAVSQESVQNRRLGPHYVPRIPCGRCGHEHHIDAASGEFIGHCTECNAFLRRPYEAEEQQFADFLEWKMLHTEAGR